MLTIKVFNNQRLLLGQMRKAIADYKMINDGERIAVGVSGKDSLVLMIALSLLQNFFDQKFYLEAITLDLGLGEIDYTYYQRLFQELGINYTIQKTNIGKIIFEERKEKNPCSLCANLRRGALHNVAKALDCQKVALGHHQDDVLETLLLSTFYMGRLHTFEPKSYLDRKDITIIRPLIYTTEEEIKEFIQINALRAFDNPCQMDGKTKRQEIKDLIGLLSKNNSPLRKNIFGAIQRSHLKGWGI